jgi:hypothetical protein
MKNLSLSLGIHRKWVRFVFMAFMAIFVLGAQVVSVKASISPPPPPNTDYWYVGTPKFTGTYLSGPTLTMWGTPVGSGFTYSPPTDALGVDPLGSTAMWLMIRTSSASYSKASTMVNGFYKTDGSPVARYISFWYQTSDVSLGSPLQVKLGNTVIASITANKSSWTRFETVANTTSTGQYELSFLLNRGSAPGTVFPQAKIDAVHCIPDFSVPLSTPPSTSFKISGGKVKWKYSDYGDFFFLVEKSSLAPGAWTMKTSGITLGADGWWTYTIPTGANHFYELYSPLNASGL